MHALPVVLCSTALIGRSLTSTISLDDNRELLISTSTRGMSNRKPVACTHMPQLWLPVCARPVSWKQIYGVMLTWCLTVNCLILTGMFGSTPSSSLRQLFSRSLLPCIRLPLLGLWTPSVLPLRLVRSSSVRFLTVKGSLNCQDRAARATFFALRECPRETSLTHTCAMGPCCREKALLASGTTPAQTTQLIEQTRRGYRTLYMPGRY